MKLLWTFLAITGALEAYVLAAVVAALPYQAVMWPLIVVAFATIGAGYRARER